MCDLTAEDAHAKVLSHSFDAYAGEFSPDSSVAITGSGLLSPAGAGNAGNLCCWDLATGSLLGPAVRLPAMVMAVAISPDGRHVLAGCSDGMVRLFDAATGQSRDQAGLSWSRSRSRS